MKLQRILLIFSIVIALLCVPLLFMIFGDSVRWSVFDFVVMGTLLFGVGFILELLLKRIKSNVKYLYIALVVILFLLLWVELSVGLFNTPFSGH